MMPPRGVQELVETGTEALRNGDFALAEESFHADSRQGTGQPQCGV